jgi:hypothetical protein
VFLGALGSEESSMNAYRFAVGSAALSAALMAGCDKPAAPASPKAEAPRPDPAHSVIVLGSGTSSAPGLRAAADLTPGTSPVSTLHAHQGAGVESGAGLRPSRGASGISP